MSSTEILKAILWQEPESVEKRFIFLFENEKTSTAFQKAGFYALLMNDKVTVFDIARSIESVRDGEASTICIYIDQYFIIPYIEGDKEDRAKKEKIISSACESVGLPYIQSSKLWKYLLIDGEMKPYVFDLNHSKVLQERVYEFIEFATGSKPAPKKKSSFNLKSIDEIEEKEIEWLISGYIPKGHITLIAGDGGSGKTSTWCQIVSAVSTGGKAYFEEDIPFERGEGEKVLYFSSEDSTAHVLKGKLKKCGANLKNIQTIEVSDESFQSIKFSSEILKEIIEESKPSLVVFDPIQSFLSADINMGSRNQMRNEVNHLLSLAEKYGTTFIIVLHTNKKSNVAGRRRVADSSDLWDISRSVLILGSTQDKDTFYLSQEKSNYGKFSDTALFKIDDGIPTLVGYTDKKDADFVRESSVEVASRSPAKEVAKRTILSSLKVGEYVSVKEFDETMKAIGISEKTLRNAKSELKQDGLIKLKNQGFGNQKQWSITKVSD